MSITLLGHMYPRNTTLLDENIAANQRCRITLNCRPSHTEMRRTEPAPYRNSATPELRRTGTCHTGMRQAGPAPLRTRHTGMRHSDLSHSGMTPY